MKEFLANIRPPKYLRYLFFIGYCWYRSFKSERDEAHRTATLFLTIPHLILFIGLFMNLMPDFSSSMGKLNTVLPICFVLGVLFYYLFLYKKKWRDYIEEFNHIKRKEQRIGIIFLFFYLSYYCFLPCDFITNI